MRISDEVAISRPPAEAFAVLADTGRWAEIDTALAEISPAGIVQAGATGTMRHRRSSLHITTSWEVIEAEAPRRLIVAVRGRGYELLETVDLEATAQGSIVRVTDILTPTSLGGRLLVAISGRTVRRDLRDRLENLRRIVEDGPTAIA